MKKILVIDDEEWLREMIQLALRQRGYDVIEAHNGPTGIEKARPETKAASQPRLDVSKLPFDPYQFIKTVPEWNDIEFDKTE